MKKQITEFKAWYDNERKTNGLVDIRYIPGDGICLDTTVEDFAAENNLVNKLIASGNTVNRPDVF